MGPNYIQERFVIYLSGACLLKGKGNFWQGNSLNFYANDDNANFDYNSNLADAYDNYGGGLLLLLGLCLKNKKAPKVSFFVLPE